MINNSLGNTVRVELIRPSAIYLPDKVSGRMGRVMPKKGEYVKVSCAPTSTYST